MWDCALFIQMTTSEPVSDKKTLCGQVDPRMYRPSHRRVLRGGKALALQSGFDLVKAAKDRAASRRLTERQLYEFTDLSLRGPSGKSPAVYLFSFY